MASIPNTCREYTIDAAAAVAAVAALVATASLWLIRKRKKSISSKKISLTSSSEDPVNPKHAGYVVGDVLRRHGIKCLYTLCGGHISPILQGASESGVRVVDLRDERSAAFAADASSRLTGKPGVVAVTAGPGVTNVVTAAKNAQLAQQPVVVLGGATATILRNRGSLQDIDQMELMRPVTKWCARASRVADIRPMMEYALRISAEGVPGPVFLEIAVDLLYPEHYIRETYRLTIGADKMGDSLLGTLVSKAIGLYMWRLFRLPHFGIPGSARIHRSATPDGRWHCNRVAKALLTAKMPVLVIGSQAVVNMSPDDATRLAKAVEQIGIPTFLGGSSRGLLGSKSNIQFRHKRSAALRQADLVVVAGFAFDFRLGYGLGIPLKTHIVAVNLDPKVLKMNRWPSHAIRAHPGLFLCGLADTLMARHDANLHVSVENRKDWFNILRERDHKRNEEIVASTTEDGHLIDPVHFFRCLDTKIGDNGVLVVDGGDFVATASYILRPRSPLSWLDPGVFGTLGVGGGFSVGALTSRPSSELWLIYGDGSCAYSLAEFDTYKRAGLAPIAIIGNDASWNQIARDQVRVLETEVGTTLRRTDYHIVAEGYGGKGLLLDDPTKIDATLNEAIELSKSGVAVCINVHLAASSFREGSLSI